MSPEPLNRGILTLVSLSIGNADDITPRAEAALTESDLVVAEDTRAVAGILKSIGAKVPTLSCFEGNEKNRVEKVLKTLASGKRVVLVSKAGTPGISDPGFVIARAAIEAGFEIDAVPGACAAISALTLSGLPSDRFCFEGFLPRKGKTRAERIKAISEFDGAVIIYEAPARVRSTLQDLSAKLGNAPAAVCREMTKQHQEIMRGGLNGLIEQLDGRSLLGEVTIVVKSSGPAAHSTERPMEAVKELKEKLGLSNRDAIKAAAICFGISKNLLYDSISLNDEEEKVK